VTYSDPKMPGNVTERKRIERFSPARFRKALNNNFEAHIAYEIILEAPEKYVDLGELLLGQFDQHDLRRANGPRSVAATAAVLRHTDDLMKSALARFFDRDQPYKYPGEMCGLIYKLGPDCRRVRAGCLQELIDGTFDEDKNKVIAFVIALGGVAKGLTTATDRLMELTYHDNAIIQGNAITSLGEIAASPDVVVPRLGELLATFEEFNPDVDYFGVCCRVAEALSGFGPNAAIVLDTIMKHLITDAELRYAEKEIDNSVLHLLGHIGPAAARALPELEKLNNEKAARRHCIELDELNAVIEAIKGEPYQTPIY